MILIVLLVINGCSTNKPNTADKESELCPLLRDFANSVPLDETKQIDLETCFQCGDSYIWRRCESYDFEPAQAVCNYWLRFAQTEFPQDNLNKTIKCFSGVYRRPFENVWLKMHDVELIYLEAVGVSEDVGITLKFNDAKEQGLPKLSIIAEHLVWDDD